MKDDHTEAPALNHKKTGSALKYTLISFTAILMINTSYTIYKNQTLTHQINALIADTALVKNQQIAERSRLDVLHEQFNLQQNQINDRIEQVNKHLSTALEERWYQNNDWLLLKIRYYLELAEINAHWNQNIQSTIELLLQADHLLTTLHQPELHTIRQAIAQEITQLRASPSIDVAGLLAKIDAMQQLLPTLPIKTSSAIPHNNTLASESTQAPLTWKNQINNSLNVLKKLVIIRHHDEPIEPLITANYESLVREACILNLQEAQWAVIQGQTDVYNLSLTQTSNMIKRVFDQTAKPTQTILQQLQALQKTPPSLQQQNIGESLKLINQILALRKHNEPVLEIKDTKKTNQPPKGETL